MCDPGGDGPTDTKHWNDFGVMNERVDLRALFGTARPIVGMIHLEPLPGAPRWNGSMDVVLEAAIGDAQVLESAGVHGIIVENYGDVPFHRDAVPAETIAAMAVISAAVTQVLSVPIGINVLRNDAGAALAIAAATGAAFVRVNVHTGAMLADQGWIEGRAHETLRLRRRLGLQCAILADIAVKHAVIPAGASIAGLARDTWYRGLADGLIVSGPATGQATAVADLLAVRQAVPDAPVWIGSGLDASNLADLLSRADGAIVGSSLSRDGMAGRGIDPDRAERFLSAVRALGTEPRTESSPRMPAG